MTTKSPFSFFSQMADHSQQQNTTSSFAWFSAPECITWVTVLGMEGAVTVTSNAVTIIVYLKERSLRKRSMYLVINQAVADMFVGAGVISEFFTSREVCGFWKIHHVSELVNSTLWFVFSSASFTNLTAISLDRAHATFRPFKYRFLKKENLWSSYNGRFDYSLALCKYYGLVWNPDFNFWTIPTLEYLIFFHYVCFAF